MRIHSLQGLRAACIGFIVLSHLSGTGNFPRSHLLEIYGNLGVRIFLVVSGYLITAQLLKEHGRTGTISLKTFYARRAFRIFPAAYAFMMAAVLTHWTALTYTVNYYQHGHHVLGHLWSLGVEEQFYLIWPLSLLLFFRKRLWIVTAVIAAGPLLRILFWLLWGRPGLEHPFPVFMDALAMGSAMSIIEPQLGRFERVLASRRFLIVPAVTALLPLVQLWNTRAYQAVVLSGLHLGIALSLKHVMLRRYAVLNAWPVVWLGAISYSLYLWQQIFLNRWSASPWTAFPQNLVLSILFATASYHLVEQPFLKLRERWTRKRVPHLLQSRADKGPPAGREPAREEHGSVARAGIVG